jgi:flagellar biosynthetic protein FlhB
MADTPDKDQQSEAPTAKRKADAARDGDVLQSRELAVALVMAAGAGWLAIGGPAFVRACTQLLGQGLQLDPGDLAQFDPMSRLGQMVLPLALPLAGLFGLALVAALAGPAVLGSAGFRPGALGFKPGRLDPLRGLGRIFSLNGLAELGKALAKVALLGGIGWWLVAGELRHFPALAQQDLPAATRLMGEIMVRAVMALVLGMALIAGLDVPIQYVRRQARLRMTRQQVKEEMRQSEGAPELKQAQRQRRHALLSGSARKAVTEAAVILTNPTHFAVALRYRPGQDAAPVVVARGRGEVALAIRELAAAHRVPTLDYPQLARAIYFTSRAGQMVAEDLFLAVATVLAFVFRLDAMLADGTPPPAVTVPPARRFDEHGRPQG